MNKQHSFLTTRTTSPRAVGDAVESLIAENFESFVGESVRKFSFSFGRRAMADIEFTDKVGFHYVVDVKTHCLDTKFNMPNLTSIKRLSRFYEEDLNYFIILKVDYKIDGLKTIVKNVTFSPIEFFSWECLTLGALGWGQIQIADGNVVKIISMSNRKAWMLKLCEVISEFYPKEIKKIHSRVKHFEKIKKFWSKKDE